MTLAIDSLTVAKTAAAVETACAHCGLAVPRGLIEPSAEHQFCCAGCRAVYETLHTCGLESYYRLRDAAEAPAKPVTNAGGTFAEFDSASFHDLYIERRSDGTAAIDLALEGVTCAACVWLVEKLPRVLDGVIEARLSLRQAIVRVVWDPTRVDLSRIAVTLDRIGYRPHPARSQAGQSVHQKEARKRLVHLGIAGALMGNIMLLALALYAGESGQMQGQYKLLFRWLSALLGTISLAWPGATFFRSAVSAVRMRTINLDVPIALALLVGGVAGLINVVFNRGEIYFDSLSVLVFLLLVGRFIQFQQQRRADDAVGLLFNLMPSTCHVVREEGTEARRHEGTESDAAGDVLDVPLEALRIGDLVEVRPGELLPADGIVESGQSNINQALLTGESLPVAVDVGTEVSAGAQNVAATLRVRVRRVGRETRVGRLMDLIERGVREKPTIVQFADKVGAWFTAVVTIAAAAVFGFWSWRSGLSPAIDHAVALLIVTCPCVLGLATPLTLAIAIGRLARRDILVKSGVALEKLSRGGNLLLDKTGTLTEGRLELLEWTGAETLPITRLVGRALPASDSHGTDHPPHVERQGPSSFSPVLGGEGRDEGLCAEGLVRESGASSAESPLTPALSHEYRGEGDSLISLRALVAELERKSIHPIGRALHEALGNAELPADVRAGLQDVTERGDGGITAILNETAPRAASPSGALRLRRGSSSNHRNVSLLAGSPRFAKNASVSLSPALQTAVERIESRGATAIVIAVDGTAVAVAGLGDRVRDDSASSVRSLRTMGWKPRILSGDARGVVSKVAGVVGIETQQAVGEVSPEQKLSAVTQSAGGETVVMVGDGINDAAALAAADVGIAVHGGAEASLSAADVYIARPGLEPLVDLVRTSRLAMRTIHRNLVVSLGYNLLAGTLAAMGLMSPLIAAIIMPISSVSVLSLAVFSITRGNGSSKKGGQSWK